jgi:diguanylate cyclase (GGDEF)-like protein
MSTISPNFSVKGIKPLSSGTIPTFIGTTLEFSHFCNEQFNTQTSFNSVLRLLVGMISDWYGLDEVVYMTLDTMVNDGERKHRVMKYTHAPAIPDEVMGSIRAALQAVVAGEDEVRQGFYIIQVAGDDYHCAQFDEAGTQRGVLVWRANDAARVRAGALIVTEKTSANDLLDYIVRTAQQSAHWLRRLDNSQALLYQDEVTGLYNYRFMDVAIDSEIRRLQRFHSPFSLLFIDLDNFKQVNDVHGHLTGSSVLKQVGVQITAAVRDVDSVIRYGGDEFVVVLLGANSRHAWMAAERVRSRIDRQEFTSEDRGHKIHITASIGVATCPEHARDKATIIRLADETMYVAKRGGKNRVIMVQHNDQNHDVALPSTRRREAP